MSCCSRLTRSTSLFYVHEAYKVYKVHKAYKVWVKAFKVYKVWGVAFRAEVHKVCKGFRV